MNNIGNTPLVELKNVVKYFDQKRPVGLIKREKVRIYALNDVSFALERGEMCAYAGPNGAGKSTTFKLLAGMLRAQSGSVRVLGKDPSSDRIPMMRRVGVLFGNRSELWFDHPVSTSFEWKKKVWSIDDKTYDENVRMFMELLDLGDIWHSYARELSLGQSMRANLAMALLHSPELLLLDEPTLGLDVLAKRRMIDFLRRINADRGVTMLITSHDMDDLFEMARRILLINKGVLAFDGDLEKLTAMTGDRRSVRLRVSGEDAPALPGARLASVEDGRYTFEYDASEVSPEAIFTAISRVPGVQDVELAREPIESVIGRLYRDWQNDAKAVL
jgi:ABC-2 type transport system ATP-binding protein